MIRQIEIFLFILFILRFFLTSFDIQSLLENIFVKKNKVFWQVFKDFFP